MTLSVKIFDFVRSPFGRAFFVLKRTAVFLNRRFVKKSSRKSAGFLELQSKKIDFPLFMARAHASAI